MSGQNPEFRKLSEPRDKIQERPGLAFLHKVLPNGSLFSCNQRTSGEKWEPYCPSALEPEDMHLWRYGTTTFDFVQVEDVYAKDEKVLENMW